MRRTGPKSEVRSAHVSSRRHQDIRCNKNLACGHRSVGREVHVEFGAAVYPPHVSIDTGDTITWLLRVSPPSALVTNSVTDFGGGWTAGPITNGGAAPVTFTNAGFFAYHTEDFISPIRWLTIGTVTIHTSGAARDAVSLAVPVEGAVYTPPHQQNPMRMAAVVRLPESQVERVEFYAGSTLLGMTMTPPYHIDVRELPSEAQHIAYARLIDTNGIAHASRPVRLSLGWNETSFVHRLPRGEILFYVAAPVRRGQIDFADDLINWRYLKSIYGPINVIDYSATNGTQRFYTWRLQNPS
jgi:hypothetical protein